jgi:hypothetical protein
VGRPVDAHTGRGALLGSSLGFHHITPPPQLLVWKQSVSLVFGALGCAGIRLPAVPSPPGSRGGPHSISSGGGAQRRQEKKAESFSWSFDNMADWLMLAALGCLFGRQVPVRQPVRR